jgi:putative sterol carrier protein
MSLAKTWSKRESSSVATIKNTTTNIKSKYRTRAEQAWKRSVRLDEGSRRSELPMKGCLRRQRESRPAVSLGFLSSL